MENKVLVAGIVGLVAASTIYVWNSENFNKIQKTILILAFVFFPIQWLGIILVLVYNNYKEENTPDKLNEKKVSEKKTELDSSIDNLLELKEKGILTIDEYNEKVSKIESQKIEVEIKNSSEYKQLKNLFENKILTADEFENKIKLLQTDEIFKSIVKRKELENSNSLVTVYRETTENKTLKIISEYNQTIGAGVYINDKCAPDGIYLYKTLTHKLIIRNGVINERFYLEKVNDFIFEKKHDREPTIGDKVYSFNGVKIKDGKLKYSFFKSFNIKNEQII